MKPQTAFKSTVPDNIGWPDQKKICDEETRKALILYLDQTRLSIRKLAIRLHRSHTSLSQYMNFCYEGDVGELEKDIQAFLRRNQAPNIVSDVICETDNHKILMSVFAFCQSRRVMGAGLGDSGGGKTTAAHECARKNPNTTIITADPTRRSSTKILRLISYRVQSIRGGSSDEILNGIIEKLRNSRQFLIIDEAHFLSWEGFELVRTIWDATSIGVCYLGMPRLYTQMKGNRAYLWDQILSRITIARSVNTITREDVKIIADSIHPGLSKSCNNYLHEIAQKSGKLRAMTALLKQAVEVSKRQRVPLTVDFLKDVKKLMTIWK